MSAARLLSLTVLLVLQLLLAWWLAGGAGTPAQHDGPWLAIDTGTIDGIEIADGQGGTVRLQRQADGWRLPGQQNFPAATDRIEALLRRLVALRPVLPVATSESAASRFRVAQDHYARRIRLLVGGEQRAVLYLGDAAGPRRAYARRGDDRAIYPVELTGRDADSRHTAWLDPRYLHRDGAGLVQLRIGALMLARHGDGWRVADLQPGETTDATKAAALVQQLLRLDFMDLAGSAGVPLADNTLLQATLGYDDGREVVYRFVDPGQQGDPLLILSDRPHVLRIGSHVLEPLLELRRADLLRGAE